MVKKNKMYHDKEYLKLVDNILKNGIKKEDRTGTGTISLPFPQMRFNLSNNSIPLLTTKKMHTRSIIYEILWYLRGDTNIKYLNDNGVRIWDDWANKDGNLGDIYGSLWRSFPPPEGYYPICRRKVDTDETKPSNLAKNTPTIDVVGKHTNKTFTNKQNLEYIVLGIDGTNANGTDAVLNTYSIQFLKSKWIKRNVPTNHVTIGKFVDQSLPSLYGTGVLGNYLNKKETKINKRLRRIWELMISRCYNVNDVHYHNYGGRGVVVCKRWQILSDFIIDVKKLNNWNKFKSHEGYELDKDYFGYNDIYHPSACSWILRYNNGQYKKTNIAVVLTNDQNIKYFPSINSAAKYLGTSSTPIRHRIRHSLTTKLKGYGVKEFTDEGYVIRNLPFYDQINNIVNTLINNPDDRRMIVNSWHPSLAPKLDIIHTPNEYAQLGYQSLPPCHAQFQFWSAPMSAKAREKWMHKNVDCVTCDGPISDEAIHEKCDRHNVPRRELRCHLYQRSCDVGLGVPFNIVQYSILTHMIAQATNHIATEFVWTGGDVHIYNNHIEQLKGQLELEPYQSPTLKLNSDVTDIDDFTYEDFEIVGYESHPIIKMPVAV